MRTLVAIAAVWLLGCSRDVATGRRCGANDQACAAMPPGGSGPDGRSPSGTGGGSGLGSGAAGTSTVGHSDEALAVHVEDIRKIAIEVVTLACAGDCADVAAVADGGNAPYSFVWEDGSTNAKRHVCLDASTKLWVSTTDTAIEDDEFGYDAQTARADLTAAVLDCSDAGTSMPTADSLCLQNPSFEGTVTPTQFEAFDAPPWNACYQGPLITYSAIADASLWPAQHWTFPAASDGSTYLALGQQLLFVGHASQILCEPISAGTPRSFLVDLARGTTAAGGEATDQVMQVLGGSECAEDEVLWTSPQLTLAWTTYCVTIRPERDMTSLGFRPLGADGGLLEGLVDHIVPIASCP